MTQEALKLALEWIEDAVVVLSHTSSAIQGGIGAEAEGVGGCSVKVVTAIKEALRENAMREVQRLGQEIEQEPVAYQDTADKCRLETVPAKGGLLPQCTDEEEYLSKAYRLANELRCHLAIAPAPQRTWVGLSDEEYIHITDSVYHQGHGLIAYYKAIEAKLKQKNGYAEEKN